MMKIGASELPLQKSGEIYHLNLRPEELADTIILVGDPGRVNNVSQRFDLINVKKKNRELHTHTGMLNGKGISVISTGMGTGSIDIVMNELDALVNIDLQTMTIKPDHKSLRIIRIGTCGILQPNIPIDTFIVSEFAIGLDGTFQFYEHDGIDEQAMVESFIEQTHWDKRLPYPYCIDRKSVV